MSLFGLGVSSLPVGAVTGVVDSAGCRVAQGLLKVPTMIMTLTVFSLSLCGGLLSESMPASARLLAQNDEVLATPLPEPRRGRARAELLESMPSLGGPIALIIGGALLTASVYLVPYFVIGSAVLAVTVVVLIVGAIMTGVGIGTLIGNIVRRARIRNELRRMERSGPYSFEPLELQRAPAPAFAMLSLPLPS